jgi:hypothetical protein
MLTRRALFLYWRDGKKGYAESAFRDTCRTSSEEALYRAQYDFPDFPDKGGHFVRPKVKIKMTDQRW